MNDLATIIRSIAILSVAIYLGFDFWDSRRVKDEREELIQLKSLEFAHKATIGMLTLLALIYVFYAELDALYIFLGIILSSLYTEIFGKIYFRRKL
ncbi:MAG: hypothetical protein KA715_09180 [Xanthomonadaceae bacterium]|nr:hypothetical protein [Xanthomonadaceae bacterium]